MRSFGCLLARTVQAGSTRGVHDASETLLLEVGPGGLGAGVCRVDPLGGGTLPLFRGPDGWRTRDGTAAASDDAPETCKSHGLVRDSYDGILEVAVI